MARKKSRWWKSDAEIDAELREIEKDPKRLADYHEQHVRGLMIGRIGRPDGKAHPDVEAEIARLEAEIARLRAS